MLVVTCLAGLFALALFTLATYLQSGRVAIVKRAQLDGALHQARAFVGLRLGRADYFEISDITASDRACLTLISRLPDSFTGYWLSGAQSWARAASLRPTPKNSARSVSFWMWLPADSGNGVMSLLRWGRDQPGQLMDFHLAAKQLRLGFGGLTAQLQSPVQLANGTWHHIGFSYVGSDNETSPQLAGADNLALYIDGIRRPVTLVRSGWTQDYLATDNSSLADNPGVMLGAFSLTQNHLRGALSDIKIWPDALTASQFATLYQARGRPVSLSVDPLVHWQLDSLPADGVSIADLAYHSPADQDNASLWQTAGPDLLFQTTEERQQKEVIIFTDTDNNSRYDLRHAEQAAGCLPLAHENWQIVASDIFSRPAEGFFHLAADNRSAPSLQLGGETGQPPLPRTARPPKPLALNQSQRQDGTAFCRPGWALTINQPGCQLASAYALFGSDYDNQSDRLTVAGANHSPDGTNHLYWNIPFASPQMRARWLPARGVLHFFMTDSSSLPIADWRRALQSVAYQPSQKNYKSFKEITFSIGEMPFLVDGQYHYYKFITPRASNFDAAKSAAAHDDNKLCHLRGYLATVTSQAENDFLASRFKADDGSWYQGWLGGSDAAQEGDWIWVDGPEANIRFWDADHTGSWNNRHTGGPVLENGADNASSRAAYNSQWTSQRKDLNTSLSGDLWRHVITAKGGAALRYTNFSAGTHTSLASCHNSNSNICEPNEYGSSDEDYLQITGSAKGHGLWNDMRTDQGCIDNPLYGVCGYYVEWGGRAGETPLNLVEIKRIDLAKYRNFCNTGS